MKPHTRSVLITVLLGLSCAATAQTMVETVTTIGVQNTLQNTGASTLKVPAVPTLPQPGAAPAQAGTPATTPATTAAPVIAITPLTTAQQGLLERAQAAFKSGDYGQARAQFETLVAQNYNNPEGHFGLALALFAQKDDKGAAFELGQFMALAPDRYEGPYNLGVIATRAGDHDQALKLYAQAATLMAGKATPAAQRQVLEALADEQTRKADFTGLSATLAALTTVAPDDLDAQFRLAQARTLAGQGPAALPGVYALLQKDPSRLDAALLLADIYVAQGLPERAMRELDAAVSRVKNGTERATLLLRKANLLATSGDTRNAVLAAQDATREDGRNAPAFARLAELRAQRNDRPGALNAYLNAVKLAPKNATYRAGLAGVRLTLGQYADAARDAAQVLKLRPDDSTLARALFIQGVAAYQQKNYAQATTSLQSSLTRSPSADTALWLGLSAYARQDYAGAADALAQSVKLNPTATARLNLASALLASARFTEAEAILRGLVTDDPKNAEAWYQLGLAQRAQQRETDAKLSLRTAANLGYDKAKGALK